VLNRKQQLKIHYQDYLLFQGRQIISQMSPETKQHLLDIIEARSALLGEKIVNNDLYNQLKGIDNDNNNRPSQAHP
jgi:hypothetical protein